MATSSFMVIYRWRLKPGMERPFIEAWRAATVLIREKSGGLGSRLHRAHDGTYVAYAMWPDEATREAGMNSDDPERVRLRGVMREAIEEAFPEVRMEAVADLIIASGVLERP